MGSDREYSATSKSDRGTKDGANDFHLRINWKTRHEGESVMEIQLLQGKETGIASRHDC